MTPLTRPIIASGAAWGLASSASAGDGSSKLAGPLTPNITLLALAFVEAGASGAHTEREGAPAGEGEDEGEGEGEGELGDTVHGALLEVGLGADRDLGARVVRVGGTGTGTGAGAGS